MSVQRSPQPKTLNASPLQPMSTGSEPNIASLFKQTSDVTPNIIHRQKRPRRHSDEVSDSLACFKEEIIATMKELLSTQCSRLDQMEDRMNSIYIQNQSIHTTNKDIEKAMNSLTEDIKSIETQLENLNRDRTQLHQQIATIETKIENLEINSLKTCIELRNVPKISKEKKSDLYNYILKLSEKLKLNTQISDIRDVYRMPSKKDNDSSSVTVEFTNTMSKYQCIEAVKSYNKANAPNYLNSSHLGLTTKEQTIYVSELLIPKMKRLLYLARDFAKTNNYTYAWSSNGRIYLRKEEGTPHIMIKSEAHLILLKTAQVHSIMESNEPTDNA